MRNTAIQIYDIHCFYWNLPIHRLLYHYNRIDIMLPISDRIFALLLLQPVNQDRGGKRVAISIIIFRCQTK